MDDHDQRMECAREFGKLWGEFDKIGKEQSEQAKAIARVEVHIVGLLKSMDRLTGAMWGLVVVAAGASLAFILGRIVT